MWIVKPEETKKGIYTTISEGRGSRKLSGAEGSEL